MAEQGDALMLLQALKDEPSFLFLAVQDGKEQPASLLWPQKPDTDAWWEEEDGQEYITKHFNLQKIAKYFRTRSQVCGNGTRAVLSHGDQVWEDTRDMEGEAKLPLLRLSNN